MAFADSIRPKPKEAGSTPHEPSKEDKDAARQALIAADRFVKQLDFVRARSEIERASTLDPSNPYLGAFIERVGYFEQQAQKHKETPPAPEPPPKSNVPPPAAAQPAPQVIKPTPPPAPAVPRAEQVSKVIEMNPRGTSPPPVVNRTEPRPIPPPTPSPEDVHSKKEIASALEEMQRQIAQLTKALDQERAAREETKKRQTDAALAQLRTEMEKAWQNGAPREEEKQRLRQMAQTLSLTEDVEHALIKEVKIEMYGRAVKQMIAKRKILRNSTTALEWLRKVYNISVQEYVENESKFLLDLVADQFKGTVLFVSNGKSGSPDLITRLKGSGYTVMTVTTPEGALERLDKIRPNIIVCDSDFSGSSLNGLTFLHVVHTNTRFDFIPFVLLCEESSWTEAQKLQLRPNEGCIKKPVDYDHFAGLLTDKMAQLRDYLSSLS